MLTTLNRYAVQPLVALKRRSRHLDYLRKLERMQFDTPEVIRARQLQMLRRAIIHAYETVPYYRELWDSLGLHPDAVRTFADWKAFPILDKSDIRKSGDRLLSSAYDKNQLRVKKTSGSTGVPLTIRIDEQGIQWKTACTLRADQWSGWTLGERTAKVWGNPEYLHFGLRGKITNLLVDRAVYLDTCHLTDERIHDFAQRLRRHQPGLLFGHAHSLYLLASELRRMGVDDVRPRGIVSTAMPLHQWQREVVEAVFGIKATNRYGCEEVSLIACECEQHAGLHIAAESVYTEVEPDGKLLITDLSNFAMPLLRYRIGDVVTATERLCPCGRGLPLLERVEGRDADYVMAPSGAMISGISLTENFALLIEGAAQVQIVQETLTFLRIRLVVDDKFTDASRQAIAQLVEETFGPSMKHDVELVDSIPQEPSGKYRFCISKVTRPGAAS